MHTDAKWLSRLIGKIHEAALDPPAWAAFFEDFAPALNSQVGLVWTNDFSDRSVEVAGADEAGSFSATYGFSDSALSAFAQHYGERNVWVADSSLHHAGSIVTDPMLYPAEQLTRTEYWADWLRPQDLFHTAAAVVSKRHERSVNVTLARSARAGAYRPEELELFRLLMPHFQSAYETHRRLRRLGQLSQASLAVLEALPFGVVLLDADGDVLHASRRAETLAVRSARLVFPEGRAIVCSRSADGARLAALLAGARQAGTRRDGARAGGQMRLAGSDGRLWLQLVVVPLPSWSGPFGVEAAAAVFIAEEGAPLAAGLGGLLQAAYGFTPRETRLAEALVDGATLQQHAERHGVSMNTVRSQLRSVMAKAGVTRQAELVRLILSGPALMRWPEDDQRIVPALDRAR